MTGDISTEAHQIEIRVDAHLPQQHAIPICRICRNQVEDARFDLITVVTVFGCVDEQDRQLRRPRRGGVLLKIRGNRNLAGQNRPH